MANQESEYFGNEEQLRRLICEMVRTITNHTRDVALKNLVGSVFDTMKVEEITKKLKAYNDDDLFLLARNFDPEDN